MIWKLRHWWMFNQECGCSASYDWIDKFDICLHFYRCGYRKMKKRFFMYIWSTNWRYIIFFSFLWHFTIGKKHDTLMQGTFWLLWDFYVTVLPLFFSCLPILFLSRKVLSLVPAVLSYSQKSIIKEQNVIGLNRSVISNLASMKTLISLISRAHEECQTTGERGKRSSCLQFEKEFWVVEESRLGMGRNLPLQWLWEEENERCHKQQWAGVSDGSWDALSLCSATQSMQAPQSLQKRAESISVPNVQKCLWSKDWGFLKECRDASLWI